MLELIGVSKRVAGEDHLYDVSLTLEKGSLNVLLGPTLSGKTSLMRLMAGLDKPSAGDIRFDGKSVLDVPVQKRNVAMVYQQFINYPSLTVYDNIASPLRIAKVPKSTVDQQVREAAELLRLTEFLDRTPLNLSGGQQQRTAIARALVKKADLVLLDEPLANLDYKLREELRVELPRIFAATGAVFVYATTEPHEALLLGGKTATLASGRVTQFGPTIDVYKQPVDLNTAQTFSDPPMNTTSIEKVSQSLRLSGHDLPLPAALEGLADGHYQVTVRPHHLSLTATRPNSVALPAVVASSEITGSESFIHVDCVGQRWVVLSHDIHQVEAGQSVSVFVDSALFFVFDQAQKLLVAPSDMAFGQAHG